METNSLKDSLTSVNQILSSYFIGKTVVLNPNSHIQVVVRNISRVLSQGTLVAFLVNDPSDIIINGKSNRFACTRIINPSEEFLLFDSYKDYILYSSDTLSDIEELAKLRDKSSQDL